MASTVTNTTLQVGATIFIPVAVKVIQEKKDVEMGRGTLAGNKVARPDVDSVTGEKVSAREGTIVKGVWDGDVFKPIAPEALEAIEDATKLETIEVSEFIALAEVPWERAQASYFLAPQKAAKGPSGATAMALFQRALAKSKKAGVVKIMLKTRQQLAVVYAQGGGLYITTLAWAEDWAQADEANLLADVTVDKAQVGMAVQLIEALSADDAQGALDSKADDLRALRGALVAEALAGKTVKGKAKKAAAPVVDGLEAALEASLAAAKGSKVPA
jgi:DNA end-binding protein Ku